MDFDDKKAAVRALGRHAAIDAGKLTGKNYDLIERFVSDLGVPKYRKRLYRGIGLTRGSMIDGAKAAKEILDNKSFRLSTFKGAKRHAESWSKHPDDGMSFARRPMGVLLMAKPSPKDIVADLEDGRVATAVRSFEYVDGMARSVRNAGYAFNEREVIVRTGNRKYNLCRNIVYLHVDAAVMKAGWDFLPEAFGSRLKGGKDEYRRDIDEIDRWMRYHFACAGGKLVYLPQSEDVYNWKNKLAG